MAEHKQNHHHTTFDRLNTQSLIKSLKSKTKCNKIVRKFNSTKSKPQSLNENLITSNSNHTTLNFNIKHNIYTKIEKGIK